MGNSKRLAIVVAGVALSVLGIQQSSSAVTIAQWTFENQSVAVNNNPTPSTGTGTASSIGMDVYPTPNVGVTTDDVVVGASGDTGANGVANLTNIWRIRAQGTTNSPANGWSSAAPIGTQGVIFAANTAGLSGPVTASFDWYATKQGEANLQVRYTTNGGTTWINTPVTLNGSDAGAQVLTNTTSSNTVLGSYVSDNLLNNGSSAGQDWFTGLTATINDPLAANNPNFAFEIVNASTGADNVNTQGTALNNSSGNWRFDNVSISASSVPEPTSLGILGLTAAGLLSRRRK